MDRDGSHPDAGHPILYGHETIKQRQLHFRDFINRATQSSRIYTRVLQSTLQLGTDYHGYGPWMGCKVMVTCILNTTDMQMFALGFLDIVSFATPDYMWFASPFLGLFPALITQTFLLRRITLFLSSLSSLWPMLDKPALKMTFIIIMSGGIIVSFLSGCIGSYWIWRSGPLWEFFEKRNNM